MERWIHFPIVHSLAMYNTLLVEVGELSTDLHTLKLTTLNMIFSV